APVRGRGAPARRTGPAPDPVRAALVERPHPDEREGDLAVEGRVTGEIHALVRALAEEALDAVAPVRERRRRRSRRGRGPGLPGEGLPARVAEPLPDGARPAATWARDRSAEATSAVRAERRVGAILVPARRAPHVRSPTRDRRRSLDARA